MSEVLSQSEIDALLSALNSGSVDADELKDLMMTSKTTVSRALYALKRYKENPPE